MIQWAGLSQRQWPELELLYAIPNGGRRGKFEAARLKAEGVKAGMLDLHLPVPRQGFIGLWIEMKAGKNKPTPEQLRKTELLRAHGHKVVVCYSSDAAIKELREYLSTGTLFCNASEGA